jgi:hypothetical protein
MRDGREKQQNSGALVYEIRLAARRTRYLVRSTVPLFVRS